MTTITRAIVAVTCVVAVAAAGCGSDADESTSAAAWRPLGPEGAQMLSLVAEPGTGRLFAGTGLGGVFRSTDGGDTWVQAGLIEMNVLALAVAPAPSGVVYAAGERVAVEPERRGGIFRSTDGGRSWRECDDGVVQPPPPFTIDPSYVPRIDALVVHPADPATLYAAGGTGIFRSRDGARSWERVADLTFDYAYVTALVIDPHPPHALYALQTNGVAKSLDEGRTWQVSAAGLESGHGGIIESYALVVDPNDAATLFAATFDGVYRSTDGGTTWQPARGGVESASAIAVAPTHPTTLYAGGSVWEGDGCPEQCFGLARSRDGGTTWTRSAGPPGAGPVGPLAVDAERPERIYANANALWRSIDSGERWLRAQQGISNTTTSALVVDPEQPTTLYTLFRDLMKSTDGGRTWAARTAGLPRRNINVLGIDPRRPATLYAGTWRENGDPTGTGLFVTHDGADSWTHLGLAGRHAESITVDPESSAALYVGTAPSRDDFDFENRDGGDVLRSTDGGVTWTTLFHFDDPEDYAARIVVDAGTPRTVYVLPFRAGILASSDGGRTWERRAVDIPTATRVRALVADPAGRLHAATDAGVFASDDAGRHWRATLPRRSANEFASDVVVDPREPGRLYASIALDAFTPGPPESAAVFASADGGATWSPLGSGLPAGGAHRLTIAGDGFASLYAVTFATGNWVVDLSRGGSAR